MGCSQSLFNNQSCAVALSPEAVGHHGGHTLVRVRLLLHLCVQTENWKSCQNSCLRTSADLLALWNHHHQQVNHCQRPARHFCACVKQDSYGEGFLAATAFGLCCAMLCMCCELLLLLRAVRRKGSWHRKAERQSVPGQQGASPWTHCHYGYEMLGKGKGALSHYRQAQFSAWTITDQSPITDSV